MKLLRVINGINIAMKWIIGTMILFMSLLVCYTVIMRYFVNKPPVWSFDMTSWITGMSVFLAGGYALLSNSHVRVDLFYDKFSPRTKSILNIITSIFLFMIVVVLVWKGFEQVATYFNNRTMAMTGLNVPMWWKWLMVPVGGVLLGLQALVNLIKDFYFVIKGVELTEEVKE